MRVWMEIVEISYQSYAQPLIRDKTNNLNSLIQFEIDPEPEGYQPADSNQGK